MRVDPRIDPLFAAWHRRDSPGCAVAVRHGDETVHAAGYGMADLEHDVPITPATVFHVASLSKQFTGFAVLLLAAERRVSLDDDVRTHVPEVPEFGERITLRHLVHHVSGLRDHSTLLRLSGWRPMDERTEADILELVRRQRTLNFPPGRDFTYCNTGYLMLAVIVRRITGAPFRAFSETRIFRPLGMAASRIRDDHTELMKGRAFAYARAKDGQSSFSVPNFDFAGSTSLHTTAEDLLRWAGNFWNPRVGGAAIVRKLQTSGMLNDGRSVKYGAGIELSSYRGLSVLKHSGWDLGYMAHLAVYPDEKFAVAVLGNLSDLPAEERARRVADVLLAKRFPEPLPPTIDLPEAALKEKAGLYRHAPSGRVLWVNLSHRVLRVASDRTGGATSGLVLKPLDAARFRGADETTEAVFDGTKMTIGEDYGVGEPFDRVPAWEPTVDALAEYEATYRSSELDAILTFRVVDGRLFVEERKSPLRSVSPAYQDAFTYDTTTCIFSRDSAGNIDGVVLSLERVSRLRFDRISRASFT